LALGLLVCGGTGGAAGCGEDEKACVTGAQGCPCYPNRTCHGGLYCGPAGLCEAVAADAGTADASALDGGAPDGGEAVSCLFDNDCDRHALAQGYLCRDGWCVPCESAGDCVASAHYGAGATCDATGRCHPQPSCLQAGCPEGVCDELSGRCRDPKPCSQVGCALGQLCQEATGQADAECLPDCEEGMAWNPVDGVCELIPDNCRTDRENSILADCDAQLRSCVEQEGGAHCGECFVGFVDHGGVCEPVVSCTALSCEAEHRRCVPSGEHSDAYCGDCQAGYTERFGVCELQPGATCDGVSPESILDQCAALGRECLEDPSGAGCGNCVTGRVENPQTGVCEVAVTCAELSCDALHRDCVETWNGQCTTCLPLYEEDPATGECRCQAGYLPDGAGSCEPIRTCADIQAGCQAAGELCVEATADHHAECQKCPAGQAWYDHQQACLLCAPCTRPGETGRVYPVASLGGHCVCETEPGYYHSESGLGGTFACDQDGDGWLTADARLALEAPAGSAEKENARCELRTIDRFVLENEWGERKEVLLSGYSFLYEPVPLYEPVNRDRADKLVNDYDYNNPLLSNYAPPLGDGGRELQPAELNPLTKACAAGFTNVNARYADYNADGHPDVDDPGVADSRADPEGRIFAMFSYFLELHRGYYEAGPNPPHGQYVIAEKSRGLYGVPGSRVALRYPAGRLQWRECRRHGDAEHTPGGAPYTMDFAQYGEEASCDWGGAPGSWCGMSHHSQFKCLLVTAPANLDPALPHHLTTTEVSGGYQPNQCAALPQSDGPVTPGASNPSDPALQCEVGPLPAAGQLVWGAAKFEDYGHADAPHADYLRGCVNECVEQASLPPDQRCQGLPPVHCRGLVDDYGRLFCYRPIELVTVPMAGQSFAMGSPPAEAHRHADETQHPVSFTSDFYYDALEVMQTEVTQDQFSEIMGYNPSRFSCSGTVCPVEQVSWYDALAFANVLSDLEGLPRCYDVGEGNVTFVCADLTEEPLYLDPYTPARSYYGQYCRDHGGIVDITDHQATYQWLHPSGHAGIVYDTWKCDGYRLPTEAEWEFLARAGTQTPMYGGTPTASACDPDPILGAVAWYCGNAGASTRGVTLRAANAFGLYDMIGNVWEWVFDRHDAYATSLEVNPEHRPFDESDVPVARGGAWNRGAGDARAARRNVLAPGEKNFGVGFRLVRTLFSHDLSRYELVTDHLTWQDAEQDCQSRGGHLVSIGSVQEQHLLRKVVGGYNFVNQTDIESVWIGLEDRVTEGVWVWSDGSPTTVQFWDWGEPNNSGNEDCVESEIRTGGYRQEEQELWNDLSCATAQPYVCEYP